MATPSTNDSLINEAKCYKCIPDGAQPQVQTYLLDQLRNTLSAGWDDLVQDPGRLSTNQAGMQAGIVRADTGQSADQLALRLIAANQTNRFWAAVQLPHTWVPGTRVHPHVHVEYQTDNNPAALTFELKYSISDINGTFQADTILSNLPMNIPANSRWKHLLFDIPEGGIDMSAFSGPSTILRLRYELTSANTTIDVVSFDLHIFKSISPVAFEP